MSSKKIYDGELYSFSRNDQRLGKGGNGAVYDVELENIELPIVAKFFEYDGKNKEERYTRFKNEVEVLSKLSDIDGIIKIIDKQCPIETPKKKDEAWYLMPKAKPYKINDKKTFEQKLDDMLHLAYILKSIHDRGYAHRDIKPENILVLNDKLVISDFGLCWGIEEERLTKENERVGPYKIMPPELECIQPELELDLDFRSSDVYLFAKVLWMSLKEDNLGFKGKYNRGDIQIYLKRENYDVDTLEPIHKLIEEATCETMKERIPIEKCIEYLTLQKEIVEGQIPEALVRRLQYEEISKKIVATSEAEELVYEDKHVIYEMLNGIISKSNIFVKNLNDTKEDKQIQITDFLERADGICQFLFYSKGEKLKEYLLSIRKMRYTKKSETIVLELEDLELPTNEYVTYSECKKGFENMFSKICFSSKQQIFIEKPSL